MSQQILWTSEELAKACQGRASADFAVSGVAFDSREISNGDLFIAMKGEASDGHLFIDKAMANGAAAVITEKPVDAPHILVDDSFKALNLMGIASRERSKATIIGVTGSAGKTGTKEALYSAFDRMSPGYAHRSVKSYNNHVGVPLSLARMADNSRYGVFEMGMNHKGELAELTKLVRPNVAIVTTIAPAHIGHFSSEADIARAKAEIFGGLEPGGTAIIPCDSPHYELLYRAARDQCDHVIGFGRHVAAESRAVDTVRAINGGTLVTAQIAGARLCYTISAPGEHWVMNSLAILAAVEAVGGDLAQAGLAMAELQGLAGRGERHNLATQDGGEALLIDESYNANPASMAATIGQLGQENSPNKTVILGAMKELGEMSDHYHAALAEPILAAGVKNIILVGEEMTILADKLANRLEAGQKLSHVNNAQSALNLLEGQLHAGDAILVKGSNATGLSAIVKSLKENTFSAGQEMKRASEEA